MDMRGLAMIGGALCLMAAPVAYRFLGPAEGAEAPAEAVAAAAPAAEATPAESERREVAGGAVFVTARD